MIRPALAWTALGVAVTVPIVAATTSPLLAWRGPVYIAAGFAGVAGLALMLVQPLLAGGCLPGLTVARQRRVHRAVGLALVAAVAMHVAGLWITSPPDVVDVLLFRSPTPFSLWGVLAMWAVFAAALLAVLRRRVRPRTWRAAHSALVVAAVAGTALHALLIQGTMGSVSKVALCVLVVGATAKAVIDLRAWAPFRRRET